MTDTTTLEAVCLCGSTKFEVVVPNSTLPLDAHMCHCNICRRTHGTLCTFHAHVPSPPSLPPMTSYKVSPDSQTTRYFCSTCGTQMCDETVGDDLCISTAVVDKAEGIFNFKNHIFVVDTKDGGFSDWACKIGDQELKYWEKSQYDSAEVSPDWKDSLKKSGLKTGEREDRLQVHCQCEGVSFYITRPDYKGEVFKKDFPDVPLPGPEPRHRAKQYEAGSWWIATDLSKYSAGNCVCTSCRLGSGSEAIQWAFVPTVFISQDDGSPFAPMFGSMKEYESSEGTWRRFCGICGAVIFWHMIEERPKMIDVAIGIMDAESGARAEDWMEWRTTKLSYTEDALNKALVEAVRVGTKKWGEAHRID